MKKNVMTLFILTVSAIAACAQNANPRPPDVGACVVPHTNGPYRCPKTSCGTYTTVTSDECNVDNDIDCQMLLRVSNCCGQYFGYAAGGDPCVITEMRDPRKRARILELVEGNEILVPTCGGAYVPAKIALREAKQKGKGDGSL
jgi:uncharacterized protein (UPF0297 family)